ncbi:MAG: hypothetical protein WC490_07410 [Candidatus Margulisiibacteriota bacterium]
MDKKVLFSDKPVANNYEKKLYLKHEGKEISVLVTSSIEGGPMRRELNIKAGIQGCPEQTASATYGPTPYNGISKSANWPLVLDAGKTLVYFYMDCERLEISAFDKPETS